MNNHSSDLNRIQEALKELKMKELPDGVEEFCEEHEITVDYYIQEFM